MADMAKEKRSPWRIWQRRRRSCKSRRGPVERIERERKGHKELQVAYKKQLQAKQKQLAVAGHEIRM
jgi:hypothetical protein